MGFGLISVLEKAQLDLFLGLSLHRQWEPELEDWQRVMRRPLRSSWGDVTGTQVGCDRRDLRKDETQPNGKITGSWQLPRPA